MDSRREDDEGYFCHAIGGIVCNLRSFLPVYVCPLSVFGGIASIDRLHARRVVGTQQQIPFRPPPPPPAEYGQSNGRRHRLNLLPQRWWRRRQKGNGQRLQRN